MKLLRFDLSQFRSLILRLLNLVQTESKVQAHFVLLEAVACAQQSFVAKN